MSIGIIGAGALGSNVARLLAKSGISATIANSRGPESLGRLVGELGPSTRSHYRAKEAASADHRAGGCALGRFRKAAWARLPTWNGRPRHRRLSTRSAFL